MLNVNNNNKPRRSLQITSFSLNKLLREAYETEIILEDKNIDFDLWCTEKSGDQPTFKYWHMVVKIILLYLAMIKSTRDVDFETYNDESSETNTGDIGWPKKNVPSLRPWHT